MIGHFVRFGPSSHQYILGILSLHYVEIKEGGGGGLWLHFNAHLFALHNNLIVYTTKGVCVGP